MFSHSWSLGDLIAPHAGRQAVSLGLCEMLPPKFIATGGSIRGRMRWTSQPTGSGS